MYYKIITSGSDPADTLAVEIHRPQPESVEIVSIPELRQLVVDYNNQMAAIQTQKDRAQSDLDGLLKMFADAGVKDVTAPMTPDLNAAVESKNTEAQVASVA